MPTLFVHIIASYEAYHLSGVFYCFLLLECLAIHPLVPSVRRHSCHVREACPVFCCNFGPFICGICCSWRHWVVKVLPLPDNWLDNPAIAMAERVYISVGFLRAAPIVRGEEWTLDCCPDLKVTELVVALAGQARKGKAPNTQGT